MVWPGWQWGLLRELVGWLHPVDGSASAHCASHSVQEPQRKWPPKLESQAAWVVRAVGEQLHSLARVVDTAGGRQSVAWRWV